MVITLGIIGTVIGAILAAGARHYPTRAARMERWGGGFFVAGIALIAWNFPMV